MNELEDVNIEKLPENAIDDKCRAKKGETWKNIVYNTQIVIQ